MEEYTWLVSETSPQNRKMWAPKGKHFGLKGVRGVPDCHGLCAVELGEVDGGGAVGGGDDVDLGMVWVRQSSKPKRASFFSFRIQDVFCTQHLRVLKHISNHDVWHPRKGKV